MPKFLKTGSNLQWGEIFFSCLTSLIIITVLIIVVFVVVVYVLYKKV